MTTLKSLVFALPLLLLACQTGGGKDTIAKLHNLRIDIKEEKIEDGPGKAMEGYRRFLEETADSPLKAEAIRRLADLKVEREYGLLSETERKGLVAASPSPAKSKPVQGRAEDAENLERAGALEAIELYKKLLKDYPTYERNDQVLYQMSRAYEELGRVEEAMDVMNRFVRVCPDSRHMDEVQFRRAEYFFTRRKYLKAEEAYGSVVKIGTASSYYQLALYKQGWTFYKQELYDEALDRFIALLDYKVSTGYDFAQTADQQEKKRIDDAFRVVSLSFSNLGGANSVVEYFKGHGPRGYEDGIYSNLGEFYFDKRRYNDAAATYNAFVGRNPFHKAAPQFQMRVIDIQTAGGFPSLVIDAKKQFVLNYGLTAGYWKHFEPATRPEVMGWLKKNLTDLAGHYHALYQSPKEIKEKKTNFAEARQWYREFLTTFPKDPESPSVNYLLADLLMENRSFDLAAVEYEKTAYEYRIHEKSSQAGYQAIYAWRQHEGGALPAAKDQAKRELVRSSLIFAEAYPEHEKAAIVLGAAADELYGMKEYEQALAAASRLIEAFPRAGTEVARSAWLVVGHSTYELARYNEAETAYGKVLALLPAGDKGREALNDNLAAAIYKQGEQANARSEYQAASDYFLRVGRAAPNSKIRVNAEYDAAAALIQLKDWKKAAVVLSGFRKLFPDHELQPEVTRKIASVYREDGQFSQAADEYERIEKEAHDDDVRREALLTAAELHEKAGSQARTMAVYRRYVESFPHPVETNLETRNKIAEALQKNSARDDYLAELRQIVAGDAGAGSERTPRTRYLGGKAALVLAEQSFDQFVAVKLVEPFKANLKRKKDLMKTATQKFNSLLDYEVGEVTAAATYYLAELHARFSTDLKESERPAGLSALEREEYELAIEEQAYPFEEKAIAMHKNNLELISRGVYNAWVDKSMKKLAEFVPARYDKPEEETPVLDSPETYQFAIARPEPPAPGAPQTAETAPPEPVVTPAESANSDEISGVVKSEEPLKVEKAASSEEAVPAAEPAQVAKPVETIKAQDGERKQKVKRSPAKKSALTAKQKQSPKSTVTRQSDRGGTDNVRIGQQRQRQLSATPVAVVK